MDTELLNKLDAILFLSGKALEIDELRKFFDFSKEDILKVLNELKENKENTGLNIKIYDDRQVQMVTNPAYGEVCLKFFNPDAKPKKLTKAALETIAIIAYNEPITKSEIESIRGVNVEKVLFTLEEKNFIKIVGKKIAIGTPNLYAITEDFKSYFGIKSLEELPNYNEVKNLAKTSTDKQISL